MKELKKDWKYVSGSDGSDASVQVRCDGRYLLIKEYESRGDIVKKSYRLEWLPSAND